MKPISVIRSRTAVLDVENIDTDRIIPARFLTTTERKGLGRFAFHDWRFDKEGNENSEFPLNKVEARDCKILIAGKNFACGSSREHAPWALLDYGIQVVLSSEIADIFRSNALKNGLIALQISPQEHAFLLKNPGIEIAIDLQQCHIELPDGGRFRFEVDGFARTCLLQGVDQLGYLLNQTAIISDFETKRSAA
ncbi:MAG TPA: 3-isopropylmalate dehydratase small subunit [Arenimonas sp.]|nr:3-isopropylmalate dehydratase small subunit [Arenimonas sp.]